MVPFNLVVRADNDISPGERIGLPDVPYSDERYGKNLATLIFPVLYGDPLESFWAGLGGLYTR